jgi:hypothetical protein
MHSGKIDLWQGCHKMGEKSSKIVPLGAPLLVGPLLSNVSQWRLDQDHEVSLRALVG